ncbi:hypothetical protein [Methylobacterium sp. J-068]|uniref:hypothetical protein n=1 Tax=Methylobacterium sp. J-068 TaxID=2836649 RepID=UPI001FB94808|nr:hypothetical protein [Methylobacterium sp. J-068]MCJ2036400.1 hypothetical protein [Methylobacterium sp. J-068]
MASGIKLPQALGLIAGSPLAKAGSVIAEKLPVTKSMGISGLGGLLSQVMSSGSLTGIMQNPMAALTSQLQAQAQQSTADVQSALGEVGQPLMAALSGGGGLAEAVIALRQAGDNLSGLGANPQGFFDLMAHTNTVGMLGEHAPAPMAFAKAAGPVDSAELLAEVQRQVEAVVQAAIGGTMAPDAAAAMISAQASAIWTVIDASMGAIQMGQNAVPMLAIASSVAGALAVPSSSSPTSVQNVIGTLVQPEARQVMDAAVTASLGVGANVHEGSKETLSLLGRLLKSIRGER